MALHGCLRGLKYIVFLINFVVWLAGMAVLGLAIYLRMDPRANHYVRAAYGSPENQPYYTYYILCYILIGVGFAVTFIGFLGCCGAFQESRCMLGSFFVFMVLVFVAELAGGAWAYVHRQKLGEAVVTTNFRHLVKKEYGKDLNVRTLLEESVDYAQRKLECCGGESPADWSGSKWELSDVHHLTRVPDSCCQDTSLPRGFTSAVCGVAGAWVDGVHPGVWAVGCGPQLVTVVQDKLVIMTVIGLGIAGIQLLSLVFSLILCCGMRRQSAGGYKR